MSQNGVSDIIMHVTPNTINGVVTNEPIDFEKYPVEVQDFMKTTHHFRGINGIYFKLIMKSQKDHKMYLGWT